LICICDESAQWLPKDLEIIYSQFNSLKKKVGQEKPALLIVLKNSSEFDFNLEQDS
jgi:hypothetical protein